MIFNNNSHSLTLFIITNKTGLSKAWVLVEDRDIVTDVNLTRLVDNEGVKRTTRDENLADVVVG